MSKDDASDFNLIAEIEENEPVAEPINTDIDKILDSMRNWKSMKVMKLGLSFRMSKMEEK